MDLKAFLYLAALVVFAFGCRTFDSRWIQKVGWLALLLASYLLGWWLTGSHVAGAMAVLVWFLLPAFEIATRVRRLRFPLRLEVKGRFAPSREVFPQLDELTDQVEACGYTQIEDAGWEAMESDHFVRLFYDEERRTQVTINLDFQGEMGMSYVSLTTRLEDGRVFTTTSFPYVPPMEFSPSQWVNRFEDAESVKDLEDQHGVLLEANGIQLEKRLPLDTEQLTTLMEEEMGLQVAHNIERGLIEKMGDDKFRYSWRGCFFLWFMTVKEMIRV
jgi:hypothetical protein